ncbi:hypothetical protein D3C78_1355650 [compost metagenome]
MIVGGNQRREAGLAHQRLQRVEYIMRGLRIEIAGRLVGEQQERRVGDGAGNGDTLLFTAGEFGRTVFTAMPHAHIVEQRAGALASFSLGETGDELRHHHIFHRREFRQEVMELINEADIAAADRGARFIRQAVAGRVVNIDLAGIGMFQQACQMQQRRFTGA